MCPVCSVSHVPGLYQVTGHDFSRAEATLIRYFPYCRRPARSIGVPGEPLLLAGVRAPGFGAKRYEETALVATGEK
jgi:hypothetical protein